MAASVEVELKELYKMLPLRRGDTTDDYHGVETVPDPYRHLEEYSDETNEWIAAQQALTSAVFATCPGKEDLKAKCMKAYNYEKWFCPSKRGDLFVWSHNTGLQNQNVMWCGETPCDNEAAGARVLLDPNTISADGTAALSTHQFSRDGTKLAYGISRSGSDWVSIYVRDVVTGEDHDGEVIEWVKFSGIEWAHDGSGFFYSRYPKPEGVGTTTDGGAAGTETAAAEFHALYFHALGTAQSEDVLIAENKSEKNWMYGCEISDDGRYLLVSISESCDPVNRLFVAELGAGGGGVAALPRDAADGCVALRKVVDNFDSGWDYVANDGDTFFFKTNAGAPNRKIVTGKIYDGPAGWTDHVPEATSVLRWADVSNGDFLSLCYMRDVKDEIAVHSLASGAHLHDLPMPGPGCIVGFAGKRELADVYFKFTGFTTPGTIYRWTAGPSSSGDAAPTVFRETTVDGLDLGAFTSSQVFFTSKDGTKVPMSIVQKKGTATDGSAPALLYGYGGFNISIPPSFNPFKLVLVAEMGGTYAVANIRGGGEYGEAWHDAGTKGNKQNVFDDFIGAAEHLIAEGYTSATRLAVQGGSNGGLLVGAVCNQRPELFRCGLAQVGVMDMLRFHRFTIGKAWCSDYGCADGSAEEFAWLRKISPYHNVRGDVAMPAMLVMTADHDDRVVPLHSFKFISELQYVAGRGEKAAEHKGPLLIRIESKAGHGAGKPTEKVCEEAAEMYAFLLKQLGVDLSA